MTRLEQYYRETVTKELMEKFQYGSAMQIPKITKITLNMGLGEAVGDKKVIEHATSDMRLISGQQPVVTLARKSIAGFKIRDGWPIGVKVTLRRERMYEFLDRLMNLALPRVRDFRGVSPKAFDGRGNYTLGLKDQLIFPEINYNLVQKEKGLNVCIVTTARTDQEARSLLRGLGMPFAQ